MRSAVASSLIAFSVSIVVEAVLKLYGHIEIRTRRDDELIKLLYEIKRGDEKGGYSKNLS